MHINQVGNLPGGHVVFKTTEAGEISATILEIDAMPRLRPCGGLHG
jgi:hypothetical protein